VHDTITNQVSQIKKGIMDKKAMRYEIAKEVFPLAIENAQMVLRHGKALEGCKTMQQGAAQLAVSYADALIGELEKAMEE
jgi:hypothetical protein